MATFIILAEMQHLFWRRNLKKSWVGAGAALGLTLWVWLSKLREVGIFRSFSFCKGSSWKDSRAGLVGYGQCSCIGLHTQTGPPFWHLILCGYHLENLNNFILQCVFCKWGLMTTKQELGFGVLTHSRLICPRLRLGCWPLHPGGGAGGRGASVYIQGKPGSRIDLMGWIIGGSRVPMNTLSLWVSSWLREWEVKYKLRRYNDSSREMTEGRKRFLHGFCSRGLIV